MALVKTKNHNSLPKVEGPIRCHKMEQAVSAYTVSVQSQPFRQGTRYHWLICGAQSPDELISWGYSPTRELAETAAQNEVNDLSSGLTQGGQVTSTSEVSTRRCLTLSRRFRRV
jgi:hypothetical protein